MYDIDVSNDVLLTDGKEIFKIQRRNRFINSLLYSMYLIVDANS